MKSFQKYFSENLYKPLFGGRGSGIWQLRCICMGGAHFWSPGAAGCNSSEQDRDLIYVEKLDKLN